MKEEILGLSAKENFASGHRACSGCGAALAMRMILKAAGDDIIVANATGCVEVFSTPYPQTAWKVPWIHSAFENAAAVASGVERALKHNGSDTKVLVIGGDGATFDIGFQALSSAIERGHDFLYICYDNNAYMNTGVQKSGATPLYAETMTSPYGKKIHGNQERQKQLPIIFATHGAYVATANIAYPQDLAAKIKKGLDFQGPAFIHLFTPCKLGWRHESNMTVKVAQLAFETGVTPLYEIENGVLKFNMKPGKLKPIGEFLKLQGRFKKMDDEEIKKTQEFINKNIKWLEEFEEKKVRLFV